MMMSAVCVSICVPVYCSSNRSSKSHSSSVHTKQQQQQQLCSQMYVFPYRLHITDNVQKSQLQNMTLALGAV
jgi:hypothetical protein